MTTAARSSSSSSRASALVATGNTKTCEAEGEAKLWSPIRGDATLSCHLFPLFGTQAPEQARICSQDEPAQRKSWFMNKHKAADITAASVSFKCPCVDVKSVFNMTAREGRKRSISCLVAVGNGNGVAGFALGKAADRNAALRKAKNRAKRHLYHIERYNNHTIYHDINSRFKRTTLRMKKQNEGYGLRCHRAVITLCKLIGIKDMYCKVDGSVNLLNITRALFTGLASQETHQNLANKKQLHVVEFQAHRGPLPVVVASPKDGARLQPESVDEVPNTKLHWDDVRAAQGTKRSIWAGVKRTVW
ncbi:hypothetical protein CCH79_00015828 [Gambusia affinis]|uniref:Small ribosomal subunit protein uS5m n=1 Tax=Gambusia affinis TaxID=33528 RepID=A0A315UP65_GAMAF|nr:hypothetical protein CCH79_00015828 [Gambusia affinis]